jgi:hypothetical protein
MLGSNQRPLPCEGSAMVCWGFLELAELPQIAVFLRCCFSQMFRRFTRVAARLLHKDQPMYSALGTNYPTRGVSADN